MSLAKLRKAKIQHKLWTKVAFTSAESYACLEELTWDIRDGFISFNKMSRTQIEFCMDDGSYYGDGIPIKNNNVEAMIRNLLIPLSISLVGKPSKKLKYTIKGAYFDTDIKVFAHPVVMNMFLMMCRTAIRIALDEYEVLKIDDKLTSKCLTNNDVASARKILEKNKDLLKIIINKTFTNYSSNTTKNVYDLCMKGVNRSMLDFKAWKPQLFVRGADLKSFK